MVGDVSGPCNKVVAITKSDTATATEIKDVHRGTCFVPDFAQKSSYMPIKSSAMATNSNRFPNEKIPLSVAELLYVTTPLLDSISVSAIENTEVLSSADCATTVTVTNDTWSLTQRAEPCRPRCSSLTYI